MPRRWSSTCRAVSSPRRRRDQGRPDRSAYPTRGREELGLARPGGAVGGERVAALAWAWTARRPDGPGLSVATAATAAALIAGTIVREAPRLALIERARATATATDAGGLPVFTVTLALGAAAIAWVVRTVRSTTF